MLERALLLQGAGCFSIVLECVPAPIAAAVTRALSIPTIGIGAGPATSGQVCGGAYETAGIVVYIKCKVLSGLLLVQVGRLHDLQPAGSWMGLGCDGGRLAAACRLIILMHGQGAGLGVHFM